MEDTIFQKQSLLTESLGKILQNVAKLLRKMIVTKFRLKLQTIAVAKLDLNNAIVQSIKLTFLTAS